MRFYHRPNIGDVLYSLPVVKHMGGGHLYLDPLPNGIKDYTSIFNNSLSFLNKQDITCSIWKGEEYDHSLEGYALTPNMSKRLRCDLVSEHFRGMGIEPPEDCYKPWLTSPGNPGRFPILLHRTERYRTGISWDWVKGLPDLYCVGFHDEIREFVSWGATLIKTETLEELAIVVNSSDIIIGNQSVVIALAVGLGKKRILDDCHWFPSNNFLGEKHYIMSSKKEYNLAKIRTWSTKASVSS